MKIHELKTDPGRWHDVLYGNKGFEVRKNDRGYQTGDLLWLKRYDRETGKYANINSYPQILVRVNYILHDYDSVGLQEGYVAMGIGRVELRVAGPPPPRRSTD